MILREVVILTFHESETSNTSELEILRTFEGQASYIGDLYRQCLPKVVTRETAKVIVDASSDLGWVDPSNIKRRLNVTFSPWTISFIEYWSATGETRKRIALDALHDGLVWLARIEGWPQEPFHVAHAGCLERGLKNEFFWRKGKAFPNSSRTASVKLFCEFDVTEARYYAVVFVKRKEVGRLLLGTTVPESYIVHVTLQSFEWITDRTVSVKFGDRYRDPPTVHDLSSLITAAQ